MLNKHVQCTKLAVCVIEADRLWVGSALDNVIRNTLRHTATTSTVEFSLQCNEKSAIISIRDHSAGVTNADLAHLFEPFFRASEA